MSTRLEMICGGSQGPDRIGKKARTHGTAVVKRPILWYSVDAGLLRAHSGREVSGMDTLATFVLSVVAGIVSDFISKWLNDQFKPGKH